MRHGNRRQRVLPLRLTRACSVQVEYIWSMYREPAATVDRLLEQAKAAPPMIDHTERPPGEHSGHEPREDVRHRL